MKWQGMELNRPFLVIQIPFSFLKSPLYRLVSPFFFYYFLPKLSMRPISGIQGSLII